MTDYVTMLDIDEEKCYTYAEELKKVVDKLNEVIQGVNDIEATIGDETPKALQSDLTPIAFLPATCTDGKYTFTLSTNVPSGVFLLTYADLFIAFPVYNMTLDKTYKVVGPSVYDGDTGAVRKIIYNYKLKKVSIIYKLEIWSGETSEGANYPLIDGYTGYLFRGIKLY